MTTYGTGAINVDGCRIEATNRPKREGDYKDTDNNTYAGRMNGSLMGGSKATGTTDLGRWPANVALDEDAARLLDAMSGERKAGSPKTGNEPKAAAFSGNLYGDAAVNGQAFSGYGDTGGASRFFYVAKASREERGPSNHHPTVKPTALMRWLVRLVTPPGGTVLDPFAGSGSTGLAADQEGFTFVGIELSEEYANIAANRLKSSAPLFLGAD